MVYFGSLNQIKKICRYTDTVLADGTMFGCIEGWSISNLSMNYAMHNSTHTL